MRASRKRNGLRGVHDGVRCSDGSQRDLLSRRKLHSNLVVSSHNTSDDDNRHHPALTFDGPIIRSSQDLAEQSWFESIDLLGWISKTGDANHGVVTEVEQRAFGKGEQVDAPCCDVLAQLPRCNLVAGCCHLVEQLRMDQMHLSQVGLRGITRNPRKMLNGCPCMGIALDAPSRNQDDLVDGLFAESVVGVAAHCDNDGSVLGNYGHETIVSHNRATSMMLEHCDRICARSHAQYWPRRGTFNATSSTDSGLGGSIPPDWPSHTMAAARRTGSHFRGQLSELGASGVSVASGVSGDFTFGASGAVDGLGALIFSTSGTSGACGASGASVTSGASVASAERVSGSFCGSTVLAASLGFTTTGGFNVGLGVTVAGATAVEVAPASAGAGALIESWATFCKDAGRLPV